MEARASYRAMNGALSLSAIPTAVHSLSETDGNLALADLSITAATRRALANDVTVCGEHEPVAYVTEYFLGDGVTTQFNLAAAPYLPSSSRSTYHSANFSMKAEIDARVWGNPGGYGFFSLGAGGLADARRKRNGWRNADQWLDPVEMGGTLLLEASGVTLANDSTGILAGFFVGLEMQSACIAGFQVTAQQGTGNVIISAHRAGRRRTEQST